jgi:hypothetical protein
MTISASYDPADNKIRLRSTSRLDRETYDRVKGAGFTWAPKQDLFVAPMWTPEREDLAIELADSGELDDEDTSLVERAEQRADRFETYQEKRVAEAERTHEAVETLANGIPLGQPILVGHHSERRARKDAERIRNGMAKAVRLWETSEYWERRAKGTIRLASYKDLPGVRVRRISGLEADERKHQREREKAMDALKLWSDLPEGPANDGDPSPALRKALFLSNYSIGTWQRWSDLDRGRMTPQEVQAEVLSNLPKVIERHERWLGHLGRRLAYERTLLAAQGHAMPGPKERTKRDLGPLCNWPAPNHVAMTKAQFKDRYHEVQRFGGRDGQPRYRQYAVLKDQRSVPVFITDAKRKDPPTRGAATEVAAE